MNWIKSVPEKTIFKTFLKLKREFDLLQKVCPGNFFKLRIYSLDSAVADEIAVSKFKLEILKESIEIPKAISHFYKKLKGFNEIDINYLCDLWKMSSKVLSL